MAILTWDNVGERLFEAGVDRGVLYIPNNGIYDTGYSWNGLTAVTETPTGAEATAQYADNIKYLNLISAEDFGGTIEAFTYPAAFAQCDGTAYPQAGVAIGQQARKSFGFSFRTRLGNDTNGTDNGYKLHLVYGALAAPSEKAYNTINDSPEAMTFSWEFTTTPVSVTGLKPTAILTVDSTKVSASALTTLENFLYGTAATSARLPLPDEVIAIFAGSIAKVTPAAPTFVAAGGTITIVPTTGVTYRRADTNAIVSGTVVIPTVGQTLVIRAFPNQGYEWDDNVDDDWAFKRTT